MVQVMRNSSTTTRSSSSKRHAVVKLETEEEQDSSSSFVDQLRPLTKRPKFSSSLQAMEGGGGDADYNPLDEPSPIGLRLKKSESFLDLIQMKLSQQHINKCLVSPKGKKDPKSISGANSGHEKLKASNFPASLLQIGTWEYKSIHEGDLVGKCYFAKHKLVWEVLDVGLKNKIEIQWSDIVAIKANFPEDGPETLEVVLARQPLFFRETNPQPRKHTLWQATSDFTGGQASTCRRHILQCQQGLLGKHFEKLIQCDPRLHFLSRQPQIHLESPYFEPRVCGFSSLDEPFENLDMNHEESIFAFQDGGSPSEVPSSSFHSETQGLLSKSQDTPSPNSGIDTYVMDETQGTRTGVQKLPRHWDQIKVPGIHPSMSMSDLVSHIGYYVAEQMASGDLVLPDSNMTSDDVLEQITQYLLNDTDHASASDEQSLMSRVNSLCCLLQPGPAQNSQGKTHNNNINVSQDSSFKQDASMSRKDSVGELLLNLPRIASLPQFLHSTRGFQ